MDQTPVAIGTRTYWVSDEEKLVLLAPEDRAEHLYIVGRTGLGKSTLLRNLIIQDLYAGRGVGLLDPHGDLARDVMDAIPRGRTNEVLHFNPGDLARPVGLNLLPKVAQDEEHLVVAGVLAAFRGIWGSSWGPRLEYILGHALAALLDHGGLTILALLRLLSDDAFRERLTAKIRAVLRLQGGDRGAPDRSDRASDLRQAIRQAHHVLPRRLTGPFVGPEGTG